MSSIRYHDNSIYWCKSGEHLVNGFRQNGPCEVHMHGTVYFSQIDNKSYNRKQGPSTIYRCGMVIFSNNQGTHRTDGPARINADGSKEYWVNNVLISDYEFFLKYGVL